MLNVVRHYHKKHIVSPTDEYVAFSLKIFMLLLRVFVYIECLIALLKLKMNNTAGISLYARHNFSSMNLRSWPLAVEILLFFFSLNPLHFEVKIVIKNSFFFTRNDLEKQVIFLPRKNLLQWICNFPYSSSHWSKEEAKFLVCLDFQSISSDARLWIGIFFFF